MKGIIYKIVCNETGDVYYGSTQTSLSQRMHLHFVDITRYENGNKDREGIIRGKEPEGVWQYWYQDGSKDFVFDYGKGLDRVRIAELEKRDEIFSAIKYGKKDPFAYESDNNKNLLSNLI